MKKLARKLGNIARNSKAAKVALVGAGIMAAASQKASAISDIVTYSNGDVTGASIIAQVYGAIPPNWRGGPGVSFLPETGFPAWHQWLPQSRQQSQVVLPNVESQSTSQKVDSI
jgi:hypothetical protein